MGDQLQGLQKTKKSKSVKRLKTNVGIYQIC